MSEIRVVVRDVEGVWTGNLHASTGDRLIASLGADPTTMAELARSLRQYEHHPKGSVVPGMSLGGDSPEPIDALPPIDAGILDIDLRAKMIVHQSTSSQFARNGQVDYHNGCYASDKKLRYTLSNDWLLLPESEWVESLSRKRESQLSSRSFDARSTLYGEPLFQFISDRVQSEIDECGGEIDDYDSIQQVFSTIHIEWLMTERSDLRGRAPRGWMLEQLEHIEGFLECSRENWSVLDRPSVGIATDSHAYRFGGAGYHEWIVYYDYVRHLIAKCWHWSHSEKDDRRKGAIIPMAGRLAWESQRWLHEPIVELQGRTPWGIVDRERQRLPEINSPEDAMIDCDCPLCVMMAEMGGVSFWYMDDSHMDIDDEFLVEMEDLSTTGVDRNLRTEDEPFRVVGSPFESNTSPMDEARSLGEIVLQAMGVGFDEHSKDERQNRASAGRVICSSVRDTHGMLMPLFEFGGILGELITQLKEMKAPQHSIELLMRDWGNLREVLKTDGEPGQAFLIHPVLDRFHRSLDEILELDGNLEKHCVQLHQALERFSEVVLEVN